MTAETARHLGQPLPVLMDLEIDTLVLWHAEAVALRDESDARLAKTVAIATANTVAAMFRKR